MKNNQKLLASSVLIIIAIVAGYFVLSKKDDTLNWKTYTDKQYGFEFKYPQTWVSTYGTTSDKRIITTVSPIANIPYKTITDAEAACVVANNRGLSDCEFGRYNSQEDYLNPKKAIEASKIGDMLDDGVIVKTLSGKGVKYLFLSGQIGEYEESFMIYGQNGDRIALSTTLWGDSQSKADATNDLRYQEFDKIISTFKFTK